MEQNTETISWSAPEYAHEKKSNDWFWALGIIAVTASVAAIIYGNYLFALLIIISATTVAFYSVREPDMVNYEIRDDGILMQSILLPYKNIQSFCIKSNEDKLLILSNKIFMPLIVIPFNDIDEKKLQEKLKSYLTENTELEEPMTHKIVNYFGF
ncbi:MAG: hypothetical protein WC795_02830 [Candidatus Paceibacterota bacterium]|jgi:hypothetical protein